MVHWSAFPGTYFSVLSDIFECMLRWSSNGNCVLDKCTMMAIERWMEIATQLARDLGH